jgi:peptidyl-prolyl cis-trans isomerase SurA
LLAAALLSAAPSKVVDRVAAVVDNEVVTLSEVEERAASEFERTEHLEPGKTRADAEREALRRSLDQIIAEKLLASQAQALQLQATDAQVDAAIADIKERNRFDDDALDRALAGQGLDRARFRQQVRRELETYQVLQYKVRGRVKISEEDLRNYHQTHPQEFEGDEEVKVRHIFLPVPEGSGPAEEAKVRAQGERVLARLRAGEEFSKVAREVSKGPSASEGGDLGWLRRGTIQKTLEDAAFALKDGAVSPLLRAGPGFHVVKVEEHRRAGGKGFEEAKEDIRNRLFEEQVGTYRQQYLDELRRDAHVEVKIPELKS